MADVDVPLDRLTGTSIHCLMLSHLPDTPRTVCGQVSLSVNSMKGRRVWLMRFSWDPLSTRAANEEFWLVNSRNWSEATDGMSDCGHDEVAEVFTVAHERKELGDVPTVAGSWV